MSLLLAVFLVTAGLWHVTRRAPIFRDTVSSLLRAEVAFEEGRWVMEGRPTSFGSLVHGSLAINFFRLGRLWRLEPEDLLFIVYLLHGLSALLFYRKAAGLISWPLLSLAVYLLGSIRLQTYPLLQDFGLLPLFLVAYFAASPGKTTLQAGIMGGALGASLCTHPIIAFLLPHWLARGWQWPRRIQATSAGMLGLVVLGTSFGAVRHNLSILSSTRTGLAVAAGLVALTAFSILILKKGEGRPEADWVAAFASAGGALIGARFFFQGFTVWYLWPLLVPGAFLAGMIPLSRSLKYGVTPLAVIFLLADSLPRVMPGSTLYSFSDLQVWEKTLGMECAPRFYITGLRARLQRILSPGFLYEDALGRLATGGKADALLLLPLPPEKAAGVPGSVVHRGAAWYCKPLTTWMEAASVQYHAGQASVTVDPARLHPPLFDPASPLLLELGYLQIFQPIPPDFPRDQPLESSFRIRPTGNDAFRVFFFPEAEARFESRPIPGAQAVPGLPWGTLLVVPAQGSDGTEVRLTGLPSLNTVHELMIPDIIELSEADIPTFFLSERWLKGEMVALTNAEGILFQALSDNGPE